MTLTLRAVSLNDQPLSQAITAHFDTQGGSIGRADHNTLALPDPERHISRQQAEISVERGHYSIKNVGSANPITVGAQSLAKGDSAALAHNDQVRIGGYLLEVIREDDDDGEASTITRGRAAVDARTSARSRPPPGADEPARANAPPSPEMGSGLAAGAMAFGELAAPLSSGNPFADLLGGAGGPKPASPRVLLPDDFDPFAAPKPAPARKPPGAGEAHLGAFDGLVPTAEPASMDACFGLTNDGGDALAAFMADARPVSRGRGQSLPEGRPKSTDPLAMFDAPQPDQPAHEGRAALHDHVPELQAAFRPTAVKSPTPQDAHEQRQPAPPPRSSAAEGDHESLWRAFCAGAGIAPAHRASLDEAQMKAVGALLRASVEGTLNLVAVRANTKHELRAPVTVIRSTANNPLKFSPDAGSALEQLLAPPLRGFMGGPEAMTDAMHDLLGHTIGTMAGTRAALEGVLDRFKPEQLESKLVERSMLDAVLPMKRKARLWELYLLHFEAIRNEAHEDFHALFGKAFLAAYEQQLDRLNAEPSPKV